MSAAEPVRRRVKVPFSVAAIQAAMGLGPGQRVERMWVTDDPHVLWVLVEGGDEMPGHPGGIDPDNGGEHTVRLPGPGWPNKDL